MSTQAHRYSRVAVLLHWIIALLIIGQIIGGKIMHGLDYSSLKFELYQFHKSFGILILLLSLFRLVWRFTHKPPPLPKGMSAIEIFGAKASHALFYVLMIGVPILGWMMVSASPTNIPTELFKTVPWPDFPGVSRSEALEDRLKDAHEFMAFAIVGLLFLHVGAALKHHFKNKDDVLTRMIPFLSEKQ